ncbi:MAG: hypothetical protein J0G37_17165 [Afipia sp.]|nr:hypothetical protein [Afipia sp.]
MVSGTIQYTEGDFALSQGAFSQAQPLALWKGACALACLGAVIGLGVATLLSKVLQPVFPAVSEFTAWGAACGAIVLVSAGAWRLSAKRSPMQEAALSHPQAFVLDESGLRLSTATAETRMDWAHFLAARIDPDAIVLRTRDETIVLLRPTFVADQATWSEAQRIVSAHVATSSGAIKPEPLS